MNWLWIFLTALIVAAVVTVVFFIGLFCGYATGKKQMEDSLNLLVTDYKKALKENTDFFKQMADAINKMSNKG